MAQFHKHFIWWMLNVLYFRGQTMSTGLCYIAIVTIGLAKVVVNSDDSLVQKLGLSEWISNMLTSMSFPIICSNGWLILSSGVCSSSFIIDLGSYWIMLNLLLTWVCLQTTQFYYKFYAEHLINCDMGMVLKEMQRVIKKNYLAVRMDSGLINRIDKCMEHMNTCIPRPLKCKLSFTCVVVLREMT